MLSRMTFLVLFSCFIQTMIKFAAYNTQKYMKSLSIKAMATIAMALSYEWHIPCHKPFMALNCR